MTRVPIPKTAETIANFTNGSIAAGGVVMTPARTHDRHAAGKGRKGSARRARGAGGSSQADKEGRAIVQ